KLAIVADSGSSSDGQDLGGGNGQANAALQTELAMTREQLDQFARENAELKSRLKDLDEQIATLKRLITLKDDQMAALQNQTADVPADRPKPVEQPAVKPIAPAPVQEKGFFDWLLNNSLLLLLGVIPIALAGFILHRRRNQQETDAEDGSDITPLDLGLDSEGDSDDAAGLPGEDELQFDEALEIDDALLDETSSEALAQQTEDALSEADIYIAYGRFNQAADLLDKAIEAEPQRSDLRLKLLEVHGENNDLDQFKEALAALESTGDQDAIREADAFKSRFPGAFETGGADADDLGLGNLDLNDQQDSDLGDLDFDLDDLYEEDEKGSSASASAESSGQQEEELDFDLDDLDDLDLDLDPAAQDSQAAFSGEGGSSLEASINDDDLDFLTEGDEVATKLDLARAYMDMGDMEGARGILEEVVEQGSEEQKQEARALLESAG
ncbi:MAG: FimV/HubP family polar landmark protein, partial [Endozoicomonas sp.]